MAQRECGEFCHPELDDLGTPCESEIRPSSDMRTPAHVSDASRAGGSDFPSLLLERGPYHAAIERTCRCW